MKKINWKDVEAVEGGFQMLPPGGYVCQITTVEDKPDKEYLDICFDVAEGKWKDHFLNSSKNFWSGHFIKSYKESAMGFFKGFLTAVSKSNQNFNEDAVSNGDERELEGKYVGLTIGHETYWNGKGEKRNRIYVDQIRSVDAIRKGDFKIPEDKINTYNQPKQAPDLGSDFTPMFDDDDVPF